MENAGAEVFVLPPDLLRKLGIHLGGAQSSQQSPINSSLSGITSSADNVKCDKTILETAQLMKKSVFLSPTFIPAASNMSGELEIANVCNEDEVMHIDIVDLEPKNIETAEVNMNINVVNNIQCEKKYNINSGVKYDKSNIPRSNTAPISHANTLSHSINMKALNSYEDIEIIKNQCSVCPTSAIIISDKVKKSNVGQNSVNSMKIFHANNYTPKTEVNVETSPAIQSLNINGNTCSISPTSTSLLEDSEVLNKINIISLEILNAPEESEFECLNYQDRANFTPVTMKTDIHVAAIENIKYMDDDEKSFSMVQNHEEADSLKEPGFSNKDLDDLKLSINMNLPNMNSDPKEISCNNFNSQSTYRNSVLCDLKNNFTNFESQVSCSNEIFFNNVSNVLTKKSFLNVGSTLHTDNNLKDILNISYESLNTDNEDEQLKNVKISNREKYNENACINNSFDSNAINQKVTKDVDLEHTNTTMNIKCVNSNNTCDSGVQHSEIQNTLNSDPSNVDILYENKSCEILTATYKKSNINIYDSDTSTGRNDENTKLINNMKPHITMKELSCNPNVSYLNSKSCIQGVEKPGGDQYSIDFCYTVPKVVNTYKKCIKLKQPIEDISDCLESKDLLEKPELIDLNSSSMIHTDFMHRTHTFCICNDFGKLGFDENENLYEHIHFWENVSDNNSKVICVQSCDIIVVEKVEEEESINIDYAEIEKETHHVKWKEPSDVTTNNQITNKALNLDSKETIAIFSCSQQSNPAETVLYPTRNLKKHKQRIVCDQSNIEKSNLPIISIDSSQEKFVCNKLVSEIIWDDLNTKERNYIALQEGYNIELDNNEFLNKLDEKLHMEGVLCCTFCKTKFKSVKLLISHINVCKEFLKSNNTDFPIIKKHTKCGVCHNYVETTNWINHIGEEHNYMAWDDSESILDLGNHEKLKEHLYNIIKQYEGLVCSKCKIAYKCVNSYLEHIKNCDAIKDGTQNTSSDDSSINTYDIINETAEITMTTKMKIHQSELDGGSINIDNVIESPEKENTVILDNPSIYLTKNKHELQENKLFLRNNSETSDEKLKDNKQNPEYSVDVVNSSTVVNSVSKADLLPPYSSQKQISKKTSESVAVIDNNKKTDEIAFMKGTDKSDPNANLYTIDNKVDSVKNYKGVEMKGNVKIEMDQPLSILSNQNVCTTSEMNVNETFANKITYLNEDTPVEQSNQIRRCTHENSIASSNEDLEKTSLSKKKKKVSKESTVSNKTTEFNVAMTTMKCGVCMQEISSSSWFDHISKDHNYLAWEHGTPSIDVNEEHEVEQHLRSMLKLYGELLCMKCGCRRKYVKPYMHHIKVCEITPNDDVENNSNETITSLNDTLHERDIKCGVCHEKMKSRDWMSHIQKSHNYIAWIEGEDVLDTNDAQQVQNHLMSLSKKNGGLTCPNCGVIRKYIKTFLQHVKSCGNVTAESDDSDAPLIKYEGTFVKCDICFEEVESNKWKNHAMSKHYNVAWIVGGKPIDLKNFYAVEKYLKEYKKKYNKLVCTICKISRMSCYGFYAHILFCGKTEEETEIFKDVCAVCNNKYICIYKHQHMAMHRDQAYAKERKLKLIEMREKGKDESQTADTPGRRKAAEKAMNVITTYKTNLNQGAGICSRCGYEEDKEGGSAEHKCSEGKDDGASDSDVTVKMEQFSKDESNDSEVDSDASYDEIQLDKRRRKNVDLNSTVNKVLRLPFSVKHIGAYIKRSYMDFCLMHFTSDILFPQWRNNYYEEISNVERANYMPPLKESCKMKFIDDEWDTYKLFESVKKQESSIAFVGGVIQCIAWAPSSIGDTEDNSGNFIAVSCHTGSDCPRYNCDETVQNSNLIQIWNVGNTDQSVPKFGFGIAHDYGTVWSMDWCPSGARDLQIVKSKDSDIEELNRLGLLAISCSNGSAYVFSVPYPSTTIQQDNPFFRIKPVAELRLSMSKNRKPCQATSLSWCPQKGHGVVIVGYSDGTTGYYDLTNDSPLLWTTENDITIIHPYHDERSHNTCVTGVGTYAAGSDIGSGTAWSSASCSGARAFAGLPGRTAGVHTHLASTAATFTSHWPSVQLTGDTYIGSLNQTVNELEWIGVGRRVSGARTWCACARCGLSAAAAPPLIRVLHAHPGYTEIKKQVVGLLEMSPIGQKRKQGNDELAIKLEPFHYDDAVKKYGLEFKLILGNNKAAQQKMATISSVPYPERYPLADVVCMAFCPSAKWHNKLAIGTHAGAIIFIDVVYSV